MPKRIIQEVLSIAIAAALFLTGCSTQNQQAVAVSSFSPMRVTAANCNYGGEFKTIEAVDAYTVRFTLCSPDAALPSKMASPVLVIQDKDYLDAAHGSSERMTINTNGTGPYQLLLNIPKSRLELKTSPTYWGIPPMSQFLDFQFLNLPSDGPSINELATNDATTSFILNDSLKTTLRVVDYLNQEKHTPMDLVYLGFNNKIKPMDNLAVRQALAMVINRSKLVQTYLPYGSLVADQMVPQGIPSGHTDNLKWYDLTPGDAHSNLVNAGFDFTQTLTLAYVSTPTRYVQNSLLIAKEIQSELAAIQIIVTLKPMSQSEFDAAMSSGTEMMFLNSFNALYSDGAAFYELPFIRQASQFGNPYVEIQQDLQAAQSETTTNGRQDKFDALNQKFKDLVPLIPIGNVPEWSFFNKNVTGAAVNGFFENFEDLSNKTNTIRILETNRPLSLWPAD